MIFHHKNIRLRHLNYIGAGWFFVTMCCANRRKLFVAPKFCGWILDAVRHNAGARAFAVHAYCLMPDHAHLLLEGLAPTSDLLQFVRALKTKTSTPFDRKNNRPLWQKKFYDHILRRNDSPDAVAWYIWMNPVRAGICRQPEEYPFLGSLTHPWRNTPRSHAAWLPPWQTQKTPPKVRRRYTSLNQTPSPS